MAPPTSLGTYRCSNCANQIDVVDTSLPLCPNCGNAEWETMIGGDGADDQFAETPTTGEDRTSSVPAT
jgi:hypothetical protein